jgi:hypothetical protein
MKPRHDFIGLRMQDELATLQSYDSLFGHTSALHDSLNIFERQMFYFLLPDIAVLAARLASRS